MSIENLYIGFINIWQIFLKKWKLSDMFRASTESGAKPGLVCRQPKSRTLFSTPHCLSKDENSLRYHQINVASNSLEKTTQAVAYQEMHVVSSPIEFYWKEGCILFRCVEQCRHLRIKVVGFHCPCWQMPVFLSFLGPHLPGGPSLHPTSCLSLTHVVWISPSKFLGINNFPRHNATIAHINHH